MILENKLGLKNALSDEINNADPFMKGIDASYSYEGYTLYKTEELEENKND
jgi:cell filamentation protein